jgi:ankyrin repeat protein
MRTLELQEYLANTSAMIPVQSTPASLLLPQIIRSSPSFPTPSYAEVPEKNQDPSVSLIMACQASNLVRVRSLLSQLTPEEINCQNERGETAFAITCYHNRTHLAARFLVTRGVDVHLANHVGLAPLHWACLNNNVRLSSQIISYDREIRNIVDTSIDILDTIGRTPLCMACIRDCLEAVRFLLRHGANINHLSKKVLLCTLPL